MFKIHSSKYRHVFCDPPKPEQTWTGFRLSTVTGEQQYIKASAKYFVVGAAGGGGPMVVGRLDRPGRFEPGTSPIVHGHSGAVLDFDFNPFDDSMFASASEDTTLKIWQIPEDWEPTDASGNAKAGKSLNEPLVDLHGHRKKVTLCRFHPTASNVLLSSSGDSAVKVWDVEKSEAIHTFEGLSDLAQDLVWDFQGDSYATSCKDKAVRFVDGRVGTETMKIPVAHDGTKTVKLSYMGQSGKVLSAGTSKQAAREIKIWDTRELSKPVHVEKIDTASGAMLPLHDPDTNVIFLSGKGDGIIRVHEFEDKPPYLHKLNDGFRSNIPSKGCCLVPKRGLRIMECETARVLKVTNNEGVHPLSFIVPRKSEAFQDDIFPDCFAPIPAYTADEWLAGESKPPATMSLDPANKGKVGDGAGRSTAPKKALKSVPVLTRELAEANKKIDDLESKLKDGNSGGGSGGNDQALKDAEAKATSATSELKAANQQLIQANDWAQNANKQIVDLEKRVKYLEEKLQAAGIEF